MFLFILPYAKQNKICGTSRIFVECGFLVSKGLWRSNQTYVDNLGVVGQPAWCFSLQLAMVILLKQKIVTLLKPWGRPQGRPRGHWQLDSGSIPEPQLCLQPRRGPILLGEDSRAWCFFSFKNRKVELSGCKRQPRQDYYSCSSKVRWSWNQEKLKWFKK